MANPADLTNPLVVDLNRTKDKLHESEADFERVHAEYTKLELIARKQLKLRLSTLSSDQPNVKSETQSNSSLGSKSKTPHSLISSKQSNSNSSRRYSSIPSTASESTRSIPKAEIKDSAEQVVNTQLIKRITQFHENVESLECLTERPVAEKSRFLKHLQRLNSAAWKTQKTKNPDIQKLEKYFK